MAAITTRQTAGTGATVKNSPLTNTEVDTNFINLNTDLSNAVYLSTNQAISGVKTFTNGFTIGGSSYPNYRASIDFGADVGGTWRKIVTISSPVGTYVTIGFKIEVTDPQANHATTGSPDSIISHTYWVACVRTNDTVQDTPDACYVRGPGNLIRAVKTSTGNYEIQVQTLTQYREITVDISVYAVNGTHTLTYSAGTTASTGTVQYNATVGGYIDWFGNLAATGKLGVGAVPQTTSELRISRSSTGNINQYGVLAELTAQSDVTSLLNGFTTSLNTQATAFTLANLRHFSVGFQAVGAGSTITNQIGFHVPSILTGATNNYAFYSDVASGTGRWNFYAAGTARNLFTGNTGIGADSGNEIKLLVGGTATGATGEIGIRTNETVQSDVTASYIGVDSLITTQAATFTLGAYTAYRAGLGVKGAGSTITTLNGFNALANLAVGTNNYAFRGQFASAANTFNLYMDGTAPNYFAGEVSVAGGQFISLAGPGGGTRITRDGGNNGLDLQTSSTSRVFISDTGPVTIRATTASTSTTTGALVVSGGIGVGENSYFAKALVVGTTLSTGTGLDLNNNNIIGVNAITFADPGPGEGISFNGNFSISESPDDLTTNSAGNLQFVSGGARRLTVKTTGQVEVTATTASTSTTTGALIVGGGVGIAGALNATTKSFIINHPTKPGKILRHGSLEGPEFGVYVRGRLDNNNMIVLPEYWTKLVDSSTITVNLTPVGSHQELYVENIVDNVVFVKNNNLFNKTINCFYTVFGERIDVEKLEVESV